MALNSNLTQALADRISSGFQEGRDMIEAQQRMVGGSDGMAFFLADNALTLGRRRISHKIAADAGAAQ